MEQREICISSRDNLESLLEGIGLKELELSGKGYYNRERGIIGLMLFVNDEPSQVIDVFFSIDSSKTTTIPMLKTLKQDP